MRVVLYPFFSQQDKITSKFKLESDSGVKLYKFMHEQMLKCGWDSTLVLPRHDQRADDGFVEPERSHTVPNHTCIDNLDRRLQWDPEWLRHVVEDCDVFLTQHEFFAYPLRCLVPDLRIAMECGIAPTTAWPQTEEMFYLSWKAADLVHCNSQTVADRVAPYCPVTVWTFAYDHQLLCERNLARDIDVLFPARASSTDYSNHKVFVTAMRNMRDSYILMTDPTNYLRLTGEAPEHWLPDAPLSRPQYEEALHRTKVVVGLTTNGYGGYAFREAVAAGAIPVAVKTPEYVELLGHEWPYYAETLDAHDVWRAVDSALKLGWAGVPQHLYFGINVNIQSCTYQASWYKAKQNLEGLYAGSFGRPRQVRKDDAV